MAEQPARTGWDGWVQVAEVGQRWEAELIAGRLRAAGVLAHVVDQSFRQEPIPRVRSFSVVRVLVPNDGAEEARRILDELAALPEDAEPVPDAGGGGDVE